MAGEGYDQELKPRGHPGGARNAFTLKSDGEPAIVAVREALARCHGGLVTPRAAAQRGTPGQRGGRRGRSHHS